MFCGVTEGAVSVGPLLNTFSPVPVEVVKSAARFAEEGVAKKVATPTPKPVIPETGTAVAVFVPVPVTPIDAPEGATNDPGRMIAESSEHVGVVGLFVQSI
jgi:hypothetical protein